MSVEIEPLELGFRRPFTVEVSQALKIKNPGPRPVAFKVKTTAPKQYCVRPNSGLVEPGSEVEVQVLLQAMRQEPPLDARCKDKFLVQSVSISPENEFASSSSIWQNLGDDTSAIQEKKIRVSWLAAETPGTLTAVTPTKPTSRESLSTPNTDAYSYSSPGEESHIADTTALPEMSSSPEPPPERETAKREVEPPAPVIKSEKMSLEGLKSSRSKEFESKKANAAARGSEEKPAAQMAVQERQSNSQGVPLNIVALIAVISFLLAYFFF